QADWPALIETLEAAARFAGNAGEERQLRARVARLWSEQVRDLDQGARAWQAVLDLEPGDAEGLAALEEGHRPRGDWAAVQEVLTRRLDFAERDADRVAIYLRLAEVSEKERGSVDEAIGYLHQVLDLDRANVQGNVEIERLLGAAQRWHELVELYQ